MTLDLFGSCTHCLSVDRNVFIAERYIAVRSVNESVHERFCVYQPEYTRERIMTRYSVFQTKLLGPLPENNPYDSFPCTGFPDTFPQAA